MFCLILILNTMKILIKKEPKLKVGDYGRISKFKNIFAKGRKIVQKKFLLLTKLKTQFCGHARLVT